jgi:DNA-binding GntR family transcriptional regulator
MAERTRNLNARVTDEELRMLNAIAEREGTTASAWLRRKIREAYRRFFDEPPPKPKTKP